MSTKSVCEHCASGCSIRTDHRRGAVLRRMAINDVAVNEEWNCDKGRWAFQYASTGDRFQFPLVRDENGELQVASWPEALEVAAAGLKAAKGVGVPTGGRVSAEDAYAYGKFARAVLSTNDIDFRARPHSAEEEEFLASSVVATGPEGGAVSYADLETATTVVLVGFEPEEESPIVFLRLRKAFRKGKTSVYAVAPFATRGLDKLGGTLIPAAPGTEAEVLRALGDGVTGDGAAARAAQALQGEGVVILVGERLATVPGALSAAAALAASSGARLAWVPRRAGERGALEAGALPTLLPGGRLVSDAGARERVAEVWDVVGLPDTPGRDGAAIIEAATTGAVNALVVGGVDAADLADPRSEEALAKTFVVSLEIRPSSVTAVADVVLPVAPQAEKGGTYVNWEGRTRTFQPALDSNAQSDYRVLDMLAAELGSFLGARTLAEVRSEMAALGAGADTRPEAPSEPVQAPPTFGSGELVLATWHHLLDRGSLQDGEPFLAGTAATALARVSPATAESFGLVDGDTVTVSTAHGSVSAPVAVTVDMVDHVVWLPTNSSGSTVRRSLGAVAGDVVTLTKGGAQ
jgi:NADH-quinone oxidoreductase subunit G